MVVFVAVEERMELRGETGGIELEKWRGILWRRLKYSVHFDKFLFRYSLLCSYLRRPVPFSFVLYLLVVKCNALSSFDILKDRKMM